jgi:hypothetical protein
MFGLWTLNQVYKQILICAQETGMVQFLFFRPGNADVNLGGSVPHGNNGFVPILSPPPGPHTFQPGHSSQPGTGGYGSSADAVAPSGPANADVSEKEGVCQVRTPE